MHQIMKAFSASEDIRADFCSGEAIPKANLLAFQRTKMLSIWALSMQTPACAHLDVRCSQQLIVSSAGILDAPIGVMKRTIQLFPVLDIQVECQFHQVAIQAITHCSANHFASGPIQDRRQIQPAFISKDEGVINLLFLGRRSSPKITLLQIGM